MPDRSTDRDYIAVMGDIIRSSTLPERAAVQQSFRELLARLNQSYAEYLVAPLEISAGDAFQGLLQRDTPVIALSQAILFSGIAPFRMGIGIGELDMAPAGRSSRELDGPAYHRARHSIDELRRQSPRCEAVQLQSADQPTERDRLVNALLLTLAALASHCSQRQREIIVAFEACGRHQGKAAEKLGITQSSVSKALRTARYPALLAGYEAAARALRVQEER